MLAISLFSGIGGIDLALADLCRTVLYCEIDPHCRGVLRARMAGGQLPQAPVHTDVTTLGKQALQDYLGDLPVDIVFGGFPFMSLTPPFSILIAKLSHSQSPYCREEHKPCNGCEEFYGRRRMAALSCTPYTSPFLPSRQGYYTHDFAVA